MCQREFVGTAERRSGGVRKGGGGAKVRRANYPLTENQHEKTKHLLVEAF